MSAVHAEQVQPWFRDRALLSQLPRRLRWLARYHELATKIWPSAYRTKGWIRGGPALVRLTGRWSARVGVGSSLPVTVDGVRVLVDFADGRFPHVLSEIRRDTPAQAVFSTLLGPGDTFIDVGANHGAYAIRAAEWVGPTGTVIAIEPQPALAQLVSGSLKLSGAGTWSVHQFACGAERDSAPLFLRAGNSGVATLNPKTDSGATTTIAVDVDRLDDRIDGEQIRGRCVVKMDVEGNELHALRGATGLLDTFRPVILFELAPGLLQRAGTPAAELIAFLDERGYALATMRSFPDTVPTSQIDLGRHQNLIAMPAERT